MTQRSEKVCLDSPVGEMAHVRGVEYAPVTLVEYGDYDFWLRARRALLVVRADAGLLVWLVAFARGGRQAEAEAQPHHAD